MQSTFRIHYQTNPAESVWLQLRTLVEKGDCGKTVEIEQEIPMRALDGLHWEASLVLKASAPLTLEYRYRVKQAGSDVFLDEWGENRSTKIHPENSANLLCLDSWRSPGTLDHILESSAFQVLLPAQSKLSAAPVPADANHEFELFMTGLPPGHVPCLVGNSTELGEWDWSRALPMSQEQKNTWRVRLKLSAQQHLYYKYGLWDEDKTRAVELESGPDRKLASPLCESNQWTKVCDDGYRRPKHRLFRGAGLAVPIFSLRSGQSLGVGEFADLIPLADWAASVGFQMIQILPVNDTTSARDWTDSYPYSAISVHALHPIYLRLDDLEWQWDAAAQQELQAARQRFQALEQLDYEAVMHFKERVTRTLHAQHAQQIERQPAFQAFIKENLNWLANYAAFCHLRDRFNTPDYTTWADWSQYNSEQVAQLTSPQSEHWPEISYYYWLQFELDQQLRRAASHAHSRGIILKGDLPIGIDRHSVEAWSTPHWFHLNAQAGAPPDEFARKGQNWGFPTYHWQRMRADGYQWWRDRFTHLGRYFDALRIDHVLGFFRIWQIPTDQIEGVMGWFDPAIPVDLEEIQNRGIAFDQERFCRPYLREHFLEEYFGPYVAEAKQHYLQPRKDGYWLLRPGVTTQREIADLFSNHADERNQRLRQGLLDCVSNVILHAEPGSDGQRFHLRWNLEETRSFRELDAWSRHQMRELYIDYYYRRQNASWEAQGLEKLPVMRNATPMLLCGEDLGVVPECVPQVMQRLGILSLEIQRMPKNSQIVFSDCQAAAYLSVISPSTHDMSTLRGWWQEDPITTKQFAARILKVGQPDAELSGEMARRILRQHLNAPSMWTVLALQDVLAIDEGLRSPDPDAERINVPAIHPFYWRYRMHLAVEQLAAATSFNGRLRRLIAESGRCGETAIWSGSHLSAPIA